MIYPERHRASLVEALGAMAVRCNPEAMKAASLLQAVRQKLGYPQQAVRYDVRSSRRNIVARNPPSAIRSSQFGKS